MDNNGQIKILVVDDNPDDIVLLEEALKYGHYRYLTEAVENGELALELLKQRSATGQAALPRLIFLDLKLPGISGIEVLKSIKSNRNLAKIVVVIFTSSNLQEEEKRCYDLKADLFFSKPYGFPEFKKMVKQLENLFFSG